MDFDTIRKEYDASPLQREELHSDPIVQLEQWLLEAMENGVAEVNAMALATASPAGIPSCRMVLLKQLSAEGLVFFTNYGSRKAQELDANPRSAVTFYWKEVHRQVCVEGTVMRLLQQESENYFVTRARGSQLGAWSSSQGEVIPSRSVLETEFHKMEKKYPSGTLIPLPPFWGGYRLIPTRFEFWQGRANRIHDRFQYILKGKAWHIDRLSP